MKAVCRIARFLFLSLILSLASAAPLALAAGPSWSDYEAGISKASKEGRFVVIDFTTSWCRDCKNMDKTTFADPGVIEKLKAFVTVRVDGEKRKDLSSKYGVLAYPTIIIIDKSGGKACQRIGYMSKEEFAAFLDYALSGAYKNTSFPGYLKSRK